jgi:phosphoribosyl-ATP pyrophosphohydrolase/phosphoribosyl-AMP cyclohydrolase
MIQNLDFTKYADGLIPAVVQDARSGKVLMVGFCNKQALKKTEETRKATFFSRSKNALWTKGETSRNFLEVQTIKYDCDADTLLFLAIPTGPTCHTGKNSCFFNGEEGSTDAELLWKTYETVVARKEEFVSEGYDENEKSYVKYLYQKGLDRITQKVGEEAVETVIAAKNENRDEFVGEFSDLLFHMMVLLAEKEVSLTEIVAKFEKRSGKKSVIPKK